MRWIVSAAAVAAMVLISTPVQANCFLFNCGTGGFVPGLYETGPGGVGLIGNDTGGIIPYTPETDLFRREIASYHCARYRKYAVITSVSRQYGDYIGFVCRFGEFWPPVLVRKY